MDYVFWLPWNPGTGIRVVPALITAACVFALITVLVVLVAYAVRGQRREAGDPLEP